jgi:ectoine hydroxylase-related dioxygenase (phytanoyl-CoA dioxygenase family)
VTYVLEYRVRSSDHADSRRTVSVLATQEQIERFARDGYLVRERLFSAGPLERLRAALDEVIAAEQDEAQSPAGRDPISRRYGGLYLQRLMEKHRAFLDLVQCEPVVSVARAVLGPHVQMRGVSARVTFPDQPNQETHWHFHQRLVPEPRPPFFSLPQTLEALIYLDDVDDANGPLCVVPGSHLWHEVELPRDDYADKPGQQLLPLPAGSCVMVHGSLWHRALPTRPDGTVRRLLIVGFGPVWMRPWGRFEGLTGELAEELLAGADEETRELLGYAGKT